MSIPFRTVTSTIQKIRNVLMCGHDFPALLQKAMCFGASEIDTTSMSDTYEWLVLFLKFLHERKSPTLTPFRPLPTYMNPFLNTVLENTTRTDVLFQRTPPLFLQVCDLLLSTLVDGLQGAIGTTNRTNPDLLRLQSLNYLNDPFYSITCFQVKVVPVRTSDSGFLISSLFLNLCR